MSETVVGIGVIALLLLSAVAVMLSENKRRKLFLQQKLKNSWGKIPEREYAYEDFHHISQFFLKIFLLNIANQCKLKTII
jgi:hypothetical protein